MARVHKIHVEEGLCDSARKLLASGEAQPEDRIEAYRGEMLCLYGEIGRAAQYQVFGMKFVKYNSENKRNRRESGDTSDLRDECER